jgi:hypothetical protein
MPRPGLATYETVLRTVTFHTSGAGETNPSRTIGFVVTDDSAVTSSKRSYTVSLN